MTAARPLARAAALGAAAGVAYFVADLTGTLAAIGGMLVVDPDSILLLLAGCAVAAVLGVSVGVVVGVLWMRFGQGRVPAWMRRHWQLLALAALVVVAASGWAARVGRNLDPPGPRPDLIASSAAPVLFVLVDTLRADTLYGADLGFPLAPRVGQLARDALVFTDAESTAGWTIPSVAAMMTGIHNWTTDASAGFLPSWAPTIATRLRRAGFATHAVVDNALLEKRNGFAAGFETFRQRSSYRFAFSLPSFRILPDRLREILRDALYVSYHGGPGVTDAALEVLRTYEDDAPLFLYVHYMDPHAPYYPHGPDPAGGEAIEFMRVADGLRAGTAQPPTAGQMVTLRHRYAGEMRALDPELGRLLDAWRVRFGRSGLVVLTSDHGEEFLEHGHLGHSLTVHREMVRVPLILSLPEGAVPADRASGRIDTPVSQLDITPTLLDLLGVEADWGPPMQGQSWMPWLRGDSDPPARPLVATHSRHGRRTFRYRTGGKTLIRTYFYDGRPAEIGLFDTASDPSELHDTSTADTATTRALTQALDEASRALVAARELDPGTVNQVDEESLRALGYIR